MSGKNIDKTPWYLQKAKGTDPWFIKIQDVNVKVYISILLIVTSAVLITPVVITPEPDHLVLDVYNWIERLEPGDTVLFVEALWSYYYRLDYSVGWSIMLHVMQRSSQMKSQGLDSLKLIIVPVTADGIVQLRDFFTRCGKFIPTNLVEGEDYVVTTYLPASSATYSKIASDPWDIIKQDNKGNNVQDLPIFEYFKSGEDVSLAISEVANTLIGLWASYDSNPVDRTTCRAPIAIAHPVQLWDSASQPVGMPIYTSGQVGGLITGIRHGSMYETLLNRNYGLPLNTGYAVWIMGAWSLPCTFMILMCILGNIGAYIERQQTSKPLGGKE